MTVWACLALLLVCSWRCVASLVADWVQVDAARHGFAVLLAAAALLWRDSRNQRDYKIEQASKPATVAGSLLLLWGALQAIAASAAVELFLSRTALLISAAGVVLFLSGWAMLRRLAAPLLLLILAIPLPALLYNPLTGMLQSLASAIAESLAQLADVPLRWEGASLVLGLEPLPMVRAFGVLQLAYPLLFAAVLYGLWAERRVAARAAIIALFFAAALLLSVVRVLAIVHFDELRPAWSYRILEYASAWPLLALACLLAMSSHQILRRRVAS